MDEKSFESIGKKIFDQIPSSLAGLSDVAKTNIKQTISGVLSESGMVSREEFDHQQRLLERTREKLDRLEKELEKLEEKLAHSSR